MLRFPEVPGCRYREVCAFKEREGDERREKLFSSVWNGRRPARWKSPGEQEALAQINPLGRQ
jgi:hypothetical protein